LFVVWKLRSGPTPLSNEVLLGEFRFDSEPLPGNSIRHAAFRLHVSLLEGATYRGHELLLRKRAKVQQEIEQLLRQAHGADFEDPALAELKRQLQAMINRTLGERVVQEVIITDLSLERFAVTPALDAPARPDDGQWKAAAPS
jgi:flagellar basal body-associated protein FliL